jgi:hypothetical protein
VFLCVLPNTVQEVISTLSQTPIVPNAIAPVLAQRILLPSAVPATKWSRDKMITTGSTTNNAEQPVEGSCPATQPPNSAGEDFATNGVRLNEVLVIGADFLNPILATNQIRPDTMFQDGISPR